jgi:protein-arginine kinase activator protein McsA
LSNNLILLSYLCQKNPMLFSFEKIGGQNRVVFFCCQKCSKTL